MQPRSQVLSPTRLSLSLFRSVEASRGEPWEQDWNLRTPAFAEMNKGGFYSKRPLPSLPNPPSYFPFVLISPFDACYAG